MDGKGNEYFKINIQYYGNLSEVWSDNFENFTHHYSNWSKVYETGKDAYEQFLEYYHFQTKMCTFVFGPMILLGLVGNVISFVTWGKLTKQNSLTSLLRALAVIDSCLLLGEVFRVLTGDTTIFYVDGWLYKAADVLWPYTRAYIHPLIYMALLANILTSVCIGMNRYIVVCRPLQAARLCTVGHARTQVICIVLFSILALLPSFFECKVIKTTDGSPIVLSTLLNNIWYYYIYHVGCYFIFGSLIPFGFLIFFCVRIIMTLRAARRQPTSRHGNRLQETRVTSMVLVLLGVFVVCHVYWWIQLFCVYFLSDTFYYHVWISYSLSCAELLIIFNSSINCWIYIIYINEFRRTLSRGCCHRSGINHGYELSQSEINRSNRIVSSTALRQ